MEDDFIKRAVNGARELPQIGDQAPAKCVAARAVSIVEKLSLRNARGRALAVGRRVVRLIGGEWWFRSYATVEAKGDDAPLVAVFIGGAVRRKGQE